MIKKIFIIGVIILFSVINVFSQKNELPKTNKVSVLGKYDSTFLMLNKYLINNNYVDKNNNTIYLFNLLSWEEFDLSDTCGIYVFGVKSSDPSYFLFFENRDKSYSIILKDSLVLILETALIFFQKNEINNEKQQLVYTYSLIKYYNTINTFLLENECLPHSWEKCP